MPTCSQCGCSLFTAWRGNDFVLLLEGLTGYIAGVQTVLNGATIVYEIYDSEGDAVAGTSGSMTSLGSGGNYDAIIDKDVLALLTLKNDYEVRVTGFQSSADFEFNLPFTYSKRGNT